MYRNCYGVEIAEATLNKENYNYIYKYFTWLIYIY